VGSLLISTGFVVIFGSVVGFVLGCIGPASELWWPDRPNGRGRPSPTALLKFGVPIGIGLVIVGAVLAG